MERERLPQTVEEWPEEALAQWHERAAIREHEGGQDRAAAEFAAEIEVRAWWVAR